MNTTDARRPGDHNPDPARPWTDEDLERFADGAMDEQEADALRAALLADPEIRAAFTHLQRTDALAAEMFQGLMRGDASATSHAMDQIARQALRRAVPRALALAAALVLLISGAFIIGRLTAPSAPSQTPHAPLAHVPTHTKAPPSTHTPSDPAADERPAVRTVLEIRLPAAGPSPSESALAARPDPAHPASGDVATTPAGASTPTPSPSREREILALGRAIRSAERARATLDAMPGEDQLEACRIWARDPSLRPVAFERLARLQNDPAYAAECARIANAMSEDKHLLAWARSHNLRTTTPTHQ